jgi:uncharacterized lipoprotein YmbA
MNHRHFSLTRRFLLTLLAGAILLTGCARSGPVRYYQLSTIPEEQSTAGSHLLKAETTIGLGPVLLPEYLDRPQIVTRGSANRLTLADRERWAEPLADTIPRVLSEDLAALLGTERIQLFPWPQNQTPDCQITIRVLQFEGGPDGTVTLVARWQVLGRGGKVLLPERRSAFTMPVPGQGQEEMVVALSRCLGRLAQEVAAGLTPLPAPLS